MDGPDPRPIPGLDPRSALADWGVRTTLALVATLVGTHLVLLLVARAVGGLPAAVRAPGLPGYHLVHAFAAVATALVGPLAGSGFWAAFALYYALHAVAAGGLARAASRVRSPDGRLERAGYGVAAAVAVLGASVALVSTLVAHQFLPDPVL